MPAFNNDGGDFDTYQFINMVSEMSDATIRYTTDGTDPTETSPIYRGSLYIEEPGTTVVKARVYADKYIPSDVREVAININYNYIDDLQHSFTVESFDQSSAMTTTITNNRFSSLNWQVTDVQYSDGSVTELSVPQNNGNEGQPLNPMDQEFALDSVIIALKPRSISALGSNSLLSSLPGIKSMESLHQKKGSQIASSTDKYFLAQLESEGRQAVIDTIASLESHPQVEYVEPNYTIRVSLTPDDTYYSMLWGLHSQSDRDIDAPEMWNHFQGSNSIMIGVIDTGIDYNHPDLQQNIWTNPGEIPGNGIDDDNNGFIDDVHGYDFVNNDGDPMDDNGHGTHCAGTIGATGNNSLGVAGVMWNSQMVALKFLNAQGSGSTANAIRAINYAAMMDIPITNNSWGSSTYSQALKDAIEASDKLFIAAAGNDADNNDSIGSYPASYNLDNIISVAASNSNDEIAPFSNYGASTVDIFAPGQNILSTVPNNRYSYKNGTSMAAPHVAGVAGLLLSHSPTTDLMTIKNTILASADQKLVLPDLWRPMDD